jgi:hypothetical protein
MHEYSVIGHSRASIGRYLGVAAGLLASLVAVLVTLALDLAGKFGFSEGISRVVIFPLNATAFYLLGHLAFDKWVWKQKLIQMLLGIPDLNGEWDCLGETKDDNGNVVFSWNATVTITQTWEKIWVYLDTGQSRSRSKSASLIKEPGRGYVLMYSYQNEPRIGEPELRAHVGYCELQLNENLQCAEGDYFNNKGRITFGRMKLTRKKVTHG